MEKVKITKILRKTQDANGNPLVNSKGNTYTRVIMTTEEYGASWMSGFGGKGNADWKAGDIVEVNVERIKKDGRDYVNFSMPDVWDEIRGIKEEIVKIKARLGVERPEEKGGNVENDPFPDEEIW